MEMTDLPPEMFEAVIEQYVAITVTEMGHGHVWNRRKVCSKYIATGNLLCT